jgi:hypothetical protein
VTRGAHARDRVSGRHKCDGRESSSALTEPPAVGVDQVDQCGWRCTASFSCQVIVAAGRASSAWGPWHSRALPEKMAVLQGTADPFVERRDRWLGAMRRRLEAT